MSTDEPNDPKPAEPKSGPYTSADDVRWWKPFNEKLMKARTQQQVDLIVEANSAKDIPVGVHRTSDGSPVYLYRKDRILVRDADVARVYAALDRDPVSSQADYDLPAPVGVHVVQLTDGEDVESTLTDLDLQLGAGVATPDHLFHVCITWCAATEPLPAWAGSRAAPGQDVETNGARSLVVVVDSGLLAPVVDAHPDLLAGVTGEEEPDTVGHYHGHGTFIAGVVRTYAPEAEVRVASAMNVGGSCSESELVVALEQALDPVPDVINLSGGSRTRNNLPPLAFEVLYENRLRHLGGTVLVAAAGNDGDRGPFWPAAFPWAVAVGALDQPPTAIAGFSNRGSWVDVYAPGTDVVGVYPNGKYTYEEPPLTGREHTFDNGVARWSGTSFAAPMVAGLIAGRMTWSGESGQLSADALLEIARGQAIRGVGAVLDAGSSAPS